MKSNSSFVIAEIGINHDGAVEEAKKLIQAAAESKADAIKFQYRNLERAYAKQITSEIGDEIVRAEIERNYLPPSTILELADFAREVGLESGISFFCKEDIEDFNNHDRFSFYKIPSVEMCNMDLTVSLLETKKMVYISTGCHNESEIVDHISKINRHENWVMMHCISNYPVIAKNAKLGYISRLQKLTNRKVGYSSHDKEWELCIAAATIGASIIERHITLNKEKLGLDHSTSSSKEEFLRLVEIIKSLRLALSGEDETRQLNQGEILNKQNLGRSLHSTKSIATGSVLTIADFVERSPQTGITYNEFKDKFEGKPIQFEINEGEALTLMHLVPAEQSSSLVENELQVLRTNRVSLPVRTHDFNEIKNKFDIRNFEFHLSFEEVLENRLDQVDIPKNCEFSIHLPDYATPNQIINPFTENNDLNGISNKIIYNVSEQAKRIQDITGKPVPIVGSLSTMESTEDNFYSNCKQLADQLANQDCLFLTQWLPPVAWYFGGSAEINAFNSSRAINFIENYQINLCLDICHFLMCLNSKTVVENDFDRLLRASKHMHIADAKGSDGEGVQLGHGNQENLSFIAKSLTTDCQKVLEVWQGHLYGYRGFDLSLKAAAALIINQ